MVAETEIHEIYTTLKMLHSFAVANKEQASAIENSLSQVISRVEVLSKSLPTLPTVGTPAKTPTSEVNSISGASDVAGNVVQHDKKKVKKVIDPNRPKRPVSAYISFFKEMNGKMKLENPDSKQTDIMKLIASGWKTCSTDIKNKYISIAAKAKEQYNDDMKKYNQTLLAEGKSALKWNAAVPQLCVEKNSKGTDRVTEVETKETTEKVVAQEIVSKKSKNVEKKSKKRLRSTSEDAATQRLEAKRLKRAAKKAAKRAAKLKRKNLAKTII